jgi:glutamate N-acetyltransferase/amino-acid N-acetyltransferase
VEVTVIGGKTYSDAKAAAKAIANSNLVKTALFGNDPNWGRILCAIGYSGADFSKEKLVVKLCGVPVCKNLRPVPFPVQKLREKLDRKVVAIDVDLGLGKHSAIAHTCDLTYDYIKINAEYHT